MALRDGDRNTAKNASTHVHNPRLHIDANYAINPTRKFATQFGKKLVLGLATHVCGTSREILSQYGFLQGRETAISVQALHCGFDIEKFARREGDERHTVCKEFGWPLDVKLVLFAGRLDRALETDHPQNHKNSWFALNVARAAVQQDPNVRLIMAGAGEAAAELKRRICNGGFRISCG